MPATYHGFWTSSPRTSSGMIPRWYSLLPVAATPCRPLLNRSFTRFRTSRMKSVSRCVFPPTVHAASSHGALPPPTHPPSPPPGYAPTNRQLVVDGLDELDLRGRARSPHSDVLRRDRGRRAAARNHVASPLAQLASACDGWTPTDRGCSSARALSEGGFHAPTPVPDHRRGHATRLLDCRSQRLHREGDGPKRTPTPLRRSAPGSRSTAST